MAEGKYSHLIEIVAQFKDTGNTSQKIEQIGAALDKTGKVAPKLDTQMKSIATAMQGVIPPEMQGKLAGIFQSFEEGSKITQLSAKQVSLLSKSLLSAGASKDQVVAITTNLQKMGVVTTQSATMMDDFSRALKRVAIVVPVWMAARMAIQAIVTPIKEVIKAFFELDAGLAKVMTVTRIAASEQKRFYGELVKAAWNYYTTSSASMKDITEAMYQIGTAGRSTTEILNGFNHVLNLSIATFGNVTEAGRVLTGILNVYGDSMSNQITATEKMRYISDLLTYTWSNHQVELNEIATAMGYVGAAGDMLDIDLKTLVGTIGFLNTGLLRGSKAGTSLLNSFIQIAASSGKLKNMGIVFDPRKPLDFVDVMSQLRQRFEETGKSLAFTESLFDVFGKRGGRAIALIVEDWDKWIKSIDVGDEKFSKFAENTKEIAEKTLPKAFAKFMKLAFIGAGKEPAGTNPLVEFFNNANKAMEESQEGLEKYKELLSKGFKLPPVKTTMTDVGAVYENVPKDLLTKLKPLIDFFELIGEAEIYNELQNQTEETGIHLASVAERTKEIWDVSGRLGYTWEQMVKQSWEMLPPLSGMTKEEMLQNEHLKSIYEYRAKNLQLAKTELKIATGITTELKAKLEQQDLDTKYSLMKIAGAKEEEIAYIAIVDKVKQINDLTTRGNEIRQKEGKELYSTINVTDVLNGNWQKILTSGSLILDKEKDILEFEKLRIQVLTSLNQKYEDQKNKLLDISMQYEKADISEKSRLRRVAELQQMSPEELARTYENEVYDKELINEYFSYFDARQQESVAKTTQLYKDLIYKMPLPEITTMRNVNTPSVAATRGVPLSEQIKPITNVTNVGAQNVEVNIDVGSLPTSEEMAELLAEQVKQGVLKDANFQDAWGRIYNIKRKPQGVK